jgi:DNA-binding IclR family transcriptional regulator
VLAYLAEPERKDVLDAGLPKLTGKTISTVASLGRELDSVRERGYAVEREEAVLGEVGIAAPIFGRAGAVVGGIGVAGPAERLHGRARETKVATVVGEAARSISRDLGAQRWPPA